MKKRWWARLARHALPQWRGFMAIIALMGAAVLFDVLRPWPLKIIIDNVLAGDASLPGGLAWIVDLPGAGTAQGTLAWLTAATVGLFLAAWLCRVAQSYLQAGVGSRMVYGLGAELFAHLQRLSLRFHGRRTTGDLVKRVASDTSCVRTLMIRVLLPLLTATLTILSMMAVMWRLDASLTFVALAVAPVLGICIWKFAGPMEARSSDLYNIQGEVMAHAEQTLSALPVVKAFTREECEGDRFSSAMLRADKAYRRLTASELRFKTATGAVLAAGTAAVIAIGANHVLEGALSLGGLIIFLSYLASLYAPLETLAYLSAGYADAAAGARRVLEVFDSDEGITDSPGAQALPENPRGEIRIDNLTFGYERDRPILNGITLAALPGETVALVGATGAGKSTLVSLILRLFDPWEGRVTFDGVDLRDLQLASLRTQVSIVLQEPFILPLSVSGNIAYGRPGASQREIEEAAVAAHAAEFISELPQGYDTILGERGATLSGGQRQRIAIARALLKDAPVLILDEPTAALDAATEALILEALDRLIRGRTTFIIAHRLSTVKKATRIAVLDGGKVIEEGTHAALLARSGAYRRLHDLQFGRELGIERRPSS